MSSISTPISTPISKPTSKSISPLQRLRLQLARDEQREEKRRDATEYREAQKRRSERPEMGDWSGADEGGNSGSEDDEPNEKRARRRNEPTANGKHQLMVANMARDEAMPLRAGGKGTRFFAKETPRFKR